MYELKDYLNAINFSKEKLLDTDDIMWEKKYPPYIINKCLSMHYDCIAQANEINGFHFLPKKIQFHFYIIVSERENDLAVNGYHLPN